METNTFTYHNWQGQPVEAEAYSEYKGITPTWNGDLYAYQFIIRDIHTKEVYYRFDYTGTVAP